MMSRRPVAQADLFTPHIWQGPPWAIKQSGPWTITDSNGGSHHVLWYFNRPFAHGGAEMIERIYRDKLQIQ